MRFFAVICLLPALCFAQVFVEDAEGTTLVKSENPPGKWDYVIERPSTSVRLNPNAAHRGNGGLRFVDDETTADAAAMATAVQISHLPAFDGGQRDWYVRFWFRLTNVLTPGAELWIGEQYGAHPNGARAVAQVHIEQPALGPDASVSIDGHDEVTLFEQTYGTVGIADGGWHLVEINVTGIGLAAAKRSLIVDGQLSATWDASFPNYSLTNVSMGEVYGRVIFRGTLDYDDIRVDNRPQGSRLQLAANGLVPDNGCYPLEIALRPSGVNLDAPAPYDVAPNITSNVPADQFFTAPDCTVPGLPILTAGGGRKTFSVQTVAPGQRIITATHVDFLSDTAAFFGGQRDAGSTAGSDAGAGPDAGTDGGASSDGGDAGVGLDAGNADGGEASVPNLKVGCGCASAGNLAPLLWIGVSAFAVRRRTRLQGQATFAAAGVP